MKQHFTDRKEERASLLAYHLEEAGQPMEAAQAAHPGRALDRYAQFEPGIAKLAEGPSIAGGTAVIRSPSVISACTCCIQVLTFGWREGISAEEARRWFEEARQLALASGNARANAWIHAAYGRNLAVSGSADDYVARTREALALATESRTGAPRRC